MKECILSAVAIAAIAGIILYALHLGHDGGLVELAIAAIAGLAGYQVAKGGTGGKPPSTPTAGGTTTP